VITTTVPARASDRARSTALLTSSTASTSAPVRAAACRISFWRRCSRILRSGRDHAISQWEQNFCLSPRLLIPHRPENKHTSAYGLHNASERGRTQRPCACRIVRHIDDYLGPSRSRGDHPETPQPTRRGMPLSTLFAVMLPNPKRFNSSAAAMANATLRS